MTRLVVAQNEFDCEEASGTVAYPGEVLFLSAERAERFLRLRLATVIRPPFAKRFEGGRMLYHRGGGWYYLVDRDGYLLKEEAVQGYDNAREAIENPDTEDTED